MMVLLIIFDITARLMGKVKRGPMAHDDKFPPVFNSQVRCRRDL